MFLNFACFVTRFLIDWHPMALRCVSVLGIKRYGPVSLLRAIAYRKLFPLLWSNFKVKNSGLMRKILGLCVSYILKHEMYKIIPGTVYQHRKDSSVLLTIEINEKIVYEVENTQPTSYDNMLVYSSDPWYPQRANVKIKDLRYTTTPCN